MFPRKPLYGGGVFFLTLAQAAFFSVTLAPLGRLIPVTVDTFYAPKKHEGSKTMTVTGMATATRLILVTVDTCDMQIKYARRRFLS